MIFIFLFIGVFSDLSFLSIADWGGCDGHPNYSPQQKHGADYGMPKIAKEINAEFVLALGDNFYEGGIHTDEYDPRFNETFEVVYSDESLQIPFYAVAGNHDHYGNVTAQIWYSNHSSRWTMPDYYYTFTKFFNTSSGDRSAQFVMIDTVMFEGPSYEENGVLIEPTGPLEPQKAAEMYDWLVNTLKASTADYIWVGGHYPVWSICNHGPSPGLVKWIRPLLEQYNVTGYIAGHDHCQAFLQEHRDGPAYAVQGNTRKTNYHANHISSNPEGSLKWYIDQTNEPEGHFGGFASFTMTGDEAVIRFHDADGYLYFHTSQKPRKIVTEESFAS